MKKTTFKTLFHSLIFAYLLLMISLVVPTEYAVITPYKTRPTNTMIEIEGHLEPNKLHSVSVISLERITGFQRMIYEMSDIFDVYKMSPYESQINLFEDIERSQLQKRASFEQAIVTAYSLSSATNPEVEIEYELTGLVVDYREAKFNQLNIGDIILEINNQTFNDYETMGLFFLDYQGEITLKVDRKGDIRTIALVKTKDDIFRFYPKYNIKSASPKYYLPGENILSGGPSAGMMYTLTIYFSLEGSLFMKENIVGTGTIRYNNQIGTIGGLRQKVYAAINEGMKHFMLPASQYQEVADLSNQINLYPVSNILEAIEVVYEINQ
ncbi:hypothetical protein JV173_03045 [Acholeplasma equirhinis]|uniref:S16 family serine protease n=1 Tax=Acholeplasma equirhinis TaxID=555393 RepID=UPI00197A7D4B|nr:S16 family serine protease [Acholeplasma equirhinis]MBN3490485.1 hypothetical protein [Acholeplasma equirhinis]